MGQLGTRPPGAVQGDTGGDWGRGGGEEAEGCHRRAGSPATGTAHTQQLVWVCDPTTQVVH